MSQILARANALEWEQCKEQGPAWEGRQKARVWAVAALKPELTAEQWDAGLKVTELCAPAFDALRRAFREPVDGGAQGDYGMATRLTAIRHLESARQAATVRVARPRAALCVELIVQGHTLAELAGGLGMWRKMGCGRPSIPDIRPAAPFVQLVLLALADHYGYAAEEHARWRAM